MARPAGTINNGSRNLCSDLVCGIRDRDRVIPTESDAASVKRMAGIAQRLVQALEVKPGVGLLVGELVTVLAATSYRYGYVWLLLLEQDPASRLDVVMTAAGDSPVLRRGFSSLWPSVKVPALMG
jgi:hypothetical protein